MSDGAETKGREAWGESAFNFTGNWREFLPIALTNLLLTIVTIGIYRFWAKARERRYLWSRTHFIDDAFEWTGTGKEMFFGFLAVMAIIIPAFLILSFGVQAMILRGYAAVAGLLVFALYFGMFYLIGVGIFRALRYRLSRTWWHGIRGGSDNGGWSYGWSWIWKMACGAMPFWILIPWAMTSLWNDRWNKMSFGQYRFEASANPDGLWGRWLLIYLAPVLAVILIGVGAGVAAQLEGEVGVGTAIGFGISLLLAYLAFLLLSLAYYAAFYRHIAGATSVAGLDFEFTARTGDWLRLILGNVGLVIITLGVGLIFLSYRNWSFMVRHLEATGEINLDTLLQSETRAPGDAEGLADAFDIGGI